VEATAAATAAARKLSSSRVAKLAVDATAPLNV